MASRAEITADLLEEFGKSSDAARAKIDRWVGDITVDLLSQNEGRFKGLKIDYHITVSTSEKAYKLPANYNSAIKDFVQLDSNGDFVDKLMIVSETTLWERRNQGYYAGAKLAYIAYLPDGDDGPGWYLILGDEPGAAGTYRFSYYRKPTANDTNVIINTNIIKEGVRSKAAEYYPNWSVSAGTYARMRQGFKEHPERHGVAPKVYPNLKTRQHNDMMYRIGNRRKW